MYDKTPYTPGMREVLKLSKAEAGRLGHDYIGPEHYLLGIIRKGDGLAVQTLNNLDVDLEELKMELERMLEVGKGPTVGPFSPNAEAKRVLDMTKADRPPDEARLDRDRAPAAGADQGGRHDRRQSACAISAWTSTRRRRKFSTSSRAATPAPSSQGAAAEAFEKSKTPALDTFGRDLTQLAREGKLDPVIGREDEIERILQILCRRTKNNPILLGEPGVGKTAIVEGLAQKIVNDDIPELLRDKRLLSLDLAAIVAGTKYRGQFEERLKAIMQEIRRSQDVLIFIDEMHTLVGAGAAEGAIDASNMLKPALSRGEIQCIGATTLEEYRKYIEKDGALERRFQTDHHRPADARADHRDPQGPALALRAAPRRDHHRRGDRGRRLPERPLRHRPLPARQGDRRDRRGRARARGCRPTSSRRRSRTSRRRSTSWTSSCAICRTSRSSRSARRSS